MSSQALTAILAAIIYAGADRADGEAGYSIESAVKKARAIRREVENTQYTE